MDVDTNVEQLEQGKTFTQAELDKIIQDRLARNEKKFEGFEEYKTIAENYKKDLEARQSEKELEELEARADEYGTTPVLAKEIKELKNKLKKYEEATQAIEKEKADKLAAEESQLKEQDRLSKQLAEFEAEFPNVDVNELANNEEFKDFIDGSHWSLNTAYKKFIKIHGEIESKALGKVMSKQLRSTSSGKVSGGSGENYGGMSSDSRELLQQWNKKNPHLAMTASEWNNK